MAGSAWIMCSAGREWAPACRVRAAKATNSNAVASHCLQQPRSLMPLVAPLFIRPFVLFLWTGSGFLPAQEAGKGPSSGSAIITPRSAGRRHLKAARAGCDMMPPVEGADDRLWAPSNHHSFTPRSRDAFAITLTDDSAMAAAAMIGDSRMPKNG